jgi:signal transduction histidine kinase
MKYWLSVILLVCSISLVAFSGRGFDHSDQPITTSRPTKAAVDSLLKKLRDNAYKDKTLELTSKVIRMGKSIKYHEAVFEAYLYQFKYALDVGDPNDEERYLSITKAMMDYAKSVGDKNNYFKGWDDKVYYYVYFLKFEKAFTEITKYRQEAIRQKMPDMEAASYLSLGNIFYSENDYSLAIQNFNKYIDMMKNKTEAFEPVHYYYICAYIHIYTQEYQEALQLLLHADDVFKRPIYPLYKDISNVDLGICYFFLHQYDKMEAIYKKYKDADSVNPYLSAVLVMLKAYHFIYIKDYNAALQEAEKMPYQEDKRLVLSHIYEAFGKEKELASVKLEILKMKDKAFPKSTMLMDMQKNMMFDLMKINKDSLLLMRQYNVLRLRKDFAQRQAEMSALQKASLKRQLEANVLHSRAVQARQQSHIIRERQKLLMMENSNSQHQYQMQNLAYKSILTLSTLLILWLCYFAIGRRKHIRRLQKEDEEIDKLEKIDVQQSEVAHQAMLEAEDADRLKDQFIEHISHAVRTSLNAIVGFSSMLISDEVKNDDDMKQKMKTIIEQNSNQLSSVVNSVLDLTNIQKGKYKMLSTPTTVEELTATAQHVEKAKMAPGVELKTKIAPDCQNIVFYTDVNRVAQSLEQLLDNAFKFTKKGQIDFVAERCTADGRQMLRFTVTNPGTPLPLDKINDIFEPFIKLDEFSPGYGLGLSFCKEIAIRLEGICFADTSYTDGVRFVFMIPLCLEERIKEGGAA